MEISFFFDFIFIVFIDFWREEKGGEGRKREKHQLAASHNAPTSNWTHNLPGPVSPYVSNKGEKPRRPTGDYYTMFKNKDVLVMKAM